jgi:hypothetical protein
MTRRLPRARTIEQGWDPTADLQALLDALTDELLSMSPGEVSAVTADADAADAVRIRRLIGRADADLTPPPPSVARRGGRAAIDRRQ